MNRFRFATTIEMDCGAEWIEYGKPRYVEVGEEIPCGNNIEEYRGLFPDHALHFGCKVASTKVEKFSRRKWKKAHGLDTPKQVW